MPVRVAVVGAGSWGTTMASLASENAPTTLWARRAEVADELRERRTNSTYLPGFGLPGSLQATADMAEAVGDADVVVMAVPSQWMRATLRLLRSHVRPWVPVVSLAKGLEEGTHKRMTEVVAEELPGHPAGALTGPNLAREILSGQGAAAVVAFADQEIGRELRNLLRNDRFRLYLSHDVVGCEVAGALKNVVAIASGMAEGLGVGDNARATVITRGLAELTRCGLALGGEAMTFAGLAGMGDLIATCMSPQSRNRHVGEQLGRGRTLAEIRSETRMVAEGVRTAPVTVELAAKLGVEMPIAQQVDRVLAGEVSALEAYRELMARREHLYEFRTG